MCQSLNIQQLYTILLQIVKSYPYVKCKQVNTFTTIHDGSIFNTSNINKTYEDYLNGFFWSRTWANQGANPSQLKKEYPILGVEHKETSIPNLCESKRCHEFYLILADLIDCPSCPKDCKRTIDQISIDTQQMLNNILKELLSYQQYEITADGETYCTWLSKGALEYGKANNLFEHYEETCNSMEDYITTDSTSFGSWGLGIIDNVVGWGLRFKVCGCAESNVTFNYDYREVKQLGATICKSCS